MSRYEHLCWQAFATVAYTLMCFEYTATFFSLCWTGQGVESYREEARERLEDCLADKGLRRGMGAEVLSSLELATARMESSDPISPYWAFGVNHGGFSSTMTTSITYLIVLLQFKVTE